MLGDAVQYLCYLLSPYTGSPNPPMFLTTILSVAPGTAYAGMKQYTCLRAIVPDSALLQLSSVTHDKLGKFSSQL